MDTTITYSQNDVFNRQLVDQIPFLWNTAKIFQKNDDDAKDLLQDTLYKALIHKKKLRNCAHLRGWLRAILKNTFFDQRNQQKRFNSEVDIDSTAFLKETPQDPVLNRLYHSSDASFYNQLSDNYILVFNHLPSRFRKFIFLHDIEGYSYRQISEYCDCPIGTVRSTLHNGRKIMLKTYKKLL